MIKISKHRLLKVERATKIAIPEVYALTDRDRRAWFVEGKEYPDIEALKAAFPNHKIKLYQSPHSYEALKAL